jgi:2-keto-myo-inositol isomerase
VHVKKCLNTITLGDQVPFEKSMSAASRAGFEGVEIFSLEPAQRHAEETGQDLNDLFESLRIQPVGFVLGGFVYQNDEEFSETVQRISQTMDLASDIGARDALLFLPSKGEMTPAEATEMATLRISAAVDLAASRGLRIGLEPIGKADFLNTPASLLPVIEGIGSANLGYTIDIFHYYTAGCRTEELREIPTERIFLIHIDDAPGLPMAELSDSMRVLPGEGEMEVVPFLRTLGEMGYDDHLSVELFNGELWSKQPDEVADLSKAALDRVMDAAGV